MKAKLLALALFGGAALFAAPALAGPDIYVAPAYDPDFYAPDIYLVPYAAVPPPDVAELYVGPPYAPLPEAFLLVMPAKAGIHQPRTFAAVVPQGIADTIGLRFSARHPPSFRGTVGWATACQAELIAAYDQKVAP
jgi:hypothetical protein